MNMIWLKLERFKHKEYIFLIINIIFFAIAGGLIGLIINSIFTDLLTPTIIYFICVGYSTMLLGLLGGLIFLYRKTE